MLAGALQVPTAATAGSAAAGRREAFAAKEAEQLRRACRHRWSRCLLTECLVAWIRPGLRTALLPQRRCERSAPVQSRARRRRR